MRMRLSHGVAWRGSLPRPCAAHKTLPLLAAGRTMWDDAASPRGLAACNDRNAAPERFEFMSPAARAASDSEHGDQTVWRAVEVEVVFVAGPARAERDPKEIGLVEDAPRDRAEEVAMDLVSRSPTLPVWDQTNA